MLMTYASPADAAAQLCDQEIVTVELFQGVLQRQPGIERIKEDARYVSYADRDAQIVWNFTTSANPAHPAVVCRRIVQTGETIAVETTSLCGGPQPACERMMRDFEQLDKSLGQYMQNQSADPSTAQ
jgi:hypothetical protein